MHVMIIPDGDRRYAHKRGLSLMDAYSQAAKKLRCLVEWLLVDLAISEFTFFGLSQANVEGREPSELNAILTVQCAALESYSQDPLIHQNEIRIRVHGDLTGLPASYITAARRAEQATQGYERRKFNLLLKYSGADDVSRSVGGTNWSNATPSFGEVIAHCMMTRPIDLLIRTAGEMRISDGPFHLMQYTEIRSVPSLFPEVTHDEIKCALRAFQNLQRSFGR